MKAFDDQLALAAEMARILADAGRYNREEVREPAAALEILRARAPFECSARYGDLDRCSTEALALQLFFSIFWGERLDLRCGGDGMVDTGQVKTHHCTDPNCCGPLPVWRDDTYDHDHRH